MNLWQWLWFCPLGVAAVRLYPDRRTCTVFPSKKLHYLCQVSNHLLTGLASACSSIYHGPWCFLSVRLELHTFPGWSYALKDDTGFAIGKIMFIQVSVFLLKQCYTSTGRKIQVRGKINRYTHICAGASKSDCQRLLITPHVWHHVRSLKSAMVGVFIPQKWANATHQRFPCSQKGVC